MSKLTVEDTSLVSVADAIRTKGGTTDALTFPDGFVSAIEGIQSGGGGAFVSLVDRSITEVTADMLKGCTTIGIYAFYNCTKLASIVIPEGVTSIGSNAFYFCKLTSIIIPGSVTSLGSSVFSNCSLLTTIEMKPTTPPTLGANAFQNCFSLEQIIVPAGSLSAYQSATNWSAYANLMAEASS